MRTVLLWPDSRLHEKAAPVTKVTEEIRATWEDMIAVMETMPGVGLAATQLGIPLRLAVVDASDERGQVIRMANPEIVSQSDRLAKGTEASPCLPGVQAQIDRPDSVEVVYDDERGVRIAKQLDGLWARSVLHQIDHLDGRLYFDRLSPVKRNMLLKRAAKKGRHK